jgi:hypothetical protein
VVLDVQVDWEKMECSGGEDGVTVTVVVVRQRAAGVWMVCACRPCQEPPSAYSIIASCQSVNQPVTQSAVSQSVSLSKTRPDQTGRDKEQRSACIYRFA